MSRIEFISMFQLAVKLLSQHHFLHKIFFQVQWMTIRDYSNLSESFRSSDMLIDFELT